VVIWTTTPWTIPQNRAVAFNPEIAYGLYEVTGPAEATSDASGDLSVADKLADRSLPQAKLDGTMCGACAVFGRGTWP
jgi:isoleucyl-tRNA synthetase